MIKEAIVQLVQVINDYSKTDEFEEKLLEIATGYDLQSLVEEAKYLGLIVGLKVDVCFNSLEPTLSIYGCQVTYEGKKLLTKQNSLT